LAYVAGGGQRRRGRNFFVQNKILLRAGGFVPPVEQEWFDGRKSPAFRVLRGASWNNNDPLKLRSSYRNNDHPVNRNDNNGFRCVLVVSGRIVESSGTRLLISRILDSHRTPGWPSPLVLHG